MSTGEFEFEPDLDDPVAVGDGAAALAAAPGAPATAAEQSAGQQPGLPPPVVNINLFGAVNRNMADLIRDVLGSPPPSPGQQVQQVQQMHLPVGSPLAAAAATHPWRVAPLARRPRGRPPGPNSIRNRPVAAAPFMPMGLGAQAPVFPPPPPVYPPPPGFGAVARGPPSATATTAQPGPATATAQPGQQGFECVVCRVSSDSLGSIPCGHLLCTHCVEGQVGLCPHSQCSATFTMDQYRRFRRN